MKQIDIPDEILIQHILFGDGQSFSTLVSRYTNALSSIAFTRLRNAEDVRDVVQEAFVIAYCNLSQLEDAGRFGAWIRRIVVNQCCKMLDKRTRTQLYLERFPHTVEVCDPALDVTAKENMRQVQQSLDSLDELHREIIVLYYFQDLKIDDIAQLVNKPAGTIKRILSEARGKLREELVELAREQFSEYYLDDEQRRRLEMIPVFPQNEPIIVVSSLDEEAPRIETLAPYGVFPALSVGAEAFYADYDYPDRKLKMVSHVSVEGPFDIKGKEAVRYDDLSFSGDGKAEWMWRPYYCKNDSSILYCAKQYGGLNSDHPLITPDQPEWGEPQPQPQSLEIVPGTMKEPHEDEDGYIVDANLWEVKIGRRSFKCLRRVGGGRRQTVGWSGSPVTCCATEEFFLADGRLLLWRRYNGEQWSERRSGKEKDAPGTYERLEEAGVPMLEIFGDRYYLWYDQIPDYAIR